MEGQEKAVPVFIPRSEHTVSRRDIDEEALEHLLQFAPSVAHELAFRLIRERGIRPHELLSIRAGDVSETKEGWALVELPHLNSKTASGRNKTGARRIIFVQTAQRLLQLAHAIETQKGPEARLFPWSLGTLPVIFCRMKKLQAQAALQEGWTNLYQRRLYDLRHAAITEMYVTGFADQEVRALVGWRPASKMPNVYVHVQERHLLDACRRVESHRYADSGDNQVNSQLSPSQTNSPFASMHHPEIDRISPLLNRYTPPSSTRNPR
jgi:integrase